MSRLAFDKVQNKRVCAALGLATANDVVIEEDGAELPLGLTLPLVLKPVAQGSSIGLEFVDSASAWPSALAKAMAHGGPVLVEEKVVGREVTVGILGGDPLPVVEIRPKTGAYDYTEQIHHRGHRVHMSGGVR